MRSTGIGGSAPKAIKMLCLCAALAAGMAANGQMYSYAYAEDAGFYSTGYPGLVRGHTPTSAVAYYIVNQGMMFDYLIDGVPTHNRVPLPTNLRVNDFRIVGDRVYFCGIDVSNNHATLGHFAISDMANVGTPVNFPVEDVSSYNPGHNILILNKLAVKEVNGAIRIMALGNQENCDPFKQMQTAIYYPDFGNSSLYHVVDFSSTNEYYFEVLATDDYFAIVGLNGWLANKLVIRRQLAALSSLHNDFLSNTYNYPTPNACFDWLTATTLDANNIAASSIYLDPTFTNSEARTQVYTFSLATMDMTHLQSFWIKRKADPMDMVYLPSVNRLVLVEPLYVEQGNHCPGFIYLNPYPTTNYTAFEHRQDNQFATYRLSRITGSHFIAANSCRWFYLNHPSLLQSTHCHVCYKRDVKIEIPIEKAPAGQNITPDPESSTYRLYADTVVLSTLQNPCLEP